MQHVQVAEIKLDTDGVADEEVLIVEKILSVRVRKRRAKKKSVKTVDDKTATTDPAEDKENKKKEEDKKEEEDSNETAKEIDESEFRFFSGSN